MTALLCPACGPVAAGPQVWRCPTCAGPLELETWSTPRAPWPQRRRGLWGFADWLPLSNRVSLGEPTTPLVALAPRQNGRTVLLKTEGALPTGSFKDRGSAVLVSRLAEQGVRGVVLDSSGNAGASVAAYCAAAGLDACVYVPAEASAAKLVQIAAYGAALVPVPGSRAAVSEAAVAGAGHGLTYASHIWNPWFLVGTQTFAFEVVEQLEGGVPDAIVIPLGAGTLLLGTYLGLCALREAGLIDRLPRLVGVQSEACAPFRAAWSGEADSGCGRSIAEGLLIASPPRLAAVLDAVRETRGSVLAVGEERIAQAVLELARRGVYAEPSGAVAYAALDSALGPEDERVVVAVTATGLKAGAAIERVLSS